MPRYFLDFTDTGELLRDYEGMELVDLEAARLEALAALGEIAKDQLDTSNNSRCWADWTISAMFG